MSEPVMVSIKESALIDLLALAGMWMPKGDVEWLRNEGLHDTANKVLRRNIERAKQRVHELESKCDGNASQSAVA